MAELISSQARVHVIRKNINAAKEGKYKLLNRTKKEEKESGRDNKKSCAPCKE